MEFLRHKKSIGLKQRIENSMKFGGKRLDLSYLDLLEVPQEVLSFTNLEDLNLSNNSITNLPDWLFDKKSLRVLSLQNNKLEILPSEISKLNNLIRINLNDNNLYSIDDGIGNIQSITTLYLRRNYLKELPKTLANLDNLKVLSVFENPLSIPYEILNSGIESIKNYLTSLEEGDQFTLLEAKLLVVGDGDVGKTELCKAVLSKGQLGETHTTKGIKISQWIAHNANNIRTYTINVWDFGGQEIYHSTHQYFLTKKSIYLFIWNARTDDDYHSFDYWLNIVSLLSDSAPIIVVQNKIDERTKEIDTKLLLNQFNNIKAFARTSATRGDGIESLKNTIIKEVEDLDHFYQTVPLAWVKIRENLEAKNKPYISYDEYLEICGQFGLNKKKAEWLSEYFHVLGVFLHFPDNLILSQILFLQPEWATTSAYKLFDDDEVINNKGYFNNDTLSRVWANYPKEKHPALLELIKRFELCFEIQREKRYIIASRLPVERPDNLPRIEHELTFYYQYFFMPAGIVERLIVRLNELISDKLFWKNGVVIKKGATSAIIESDRFARRINIILEGPTKTDLLSIIRNEIDQIHTSLNNPKFDEKIPCVCNSCLKADPYYFDFSDIDRARTKKRKTIECRNSFEAVPIKAILGGIDGSIESKENQILKMLQELVDQYDTKESLEEKINESLHLKPNFFGVGVNLNYLIAKALKWKASRKVPSS